VLLADASIAEFLAEEITTERGNLRKLENISVIRFH